MADGRQRFNYGGFTHSVLRAISGLVVLQHGLQKFFGVFGGHQVEHWASLQGVAAPLETIGGVLVAVGLLTRPAAFLLSGEMAVAYWLFHAPRGFVPVVNHGEVPLMLCFVFLYIAASGPGPYSLDALLRARRAPRGAPVAA